MLRQSNHQMDQHSAGSVGRSIRALPVRLPIGFRWNPIVSDHSVPFGSCQIPPLYPCSYPTQRSCLRRSGFDQPRHSESAALDAFRSAPLRARSGRIRSAALTMRSDPLTIRSDPQQREPIGPRRVARGKTIWTNAARSAGEWETAPGTRRVTGRP